MYLSHGAWCARLFLVTKSKWQEKREASLDALVSSAMRAFNERGYAATRVADIVEGTGYTSGSFYFHFKDKRECFWHVVAYRERRRGDWSSFVTDLDPKTTGLDAVVRRGVAILAESEDAPNWPLVMVDFFQQHRDDAEVAERLEAVYARWHEELERFIRRLQAGGWVDARLNATQLTTEVFALAHGLTIHAALYRIAPESGQGAYIDGIVRLLGGKP